MKIYIALGGLAGRALREYARQANLLNDQCYYIDADPCSGYREGGEAEHVHLVGRLRFGTGALRAIGRNAMRYEIYTRRLDPMFDAVKQFDGVELVFITSSFGGFGSAAVAEMVEYLQAMFWQKLDRNGCSCRVIAFNENCFRAMFGGAGVLHMYELNTLDFLSDMARIRPLPKESVMVQDSHELFVPECRLYLVDTQGMQMNRLYTLLQMSDAQLQALDCQQKYQIRANRQSPSVFISYSSKDQAVADRLVQSLEKLGVGSWIASESIESGSYAKQIVRGIREAKVFVVLVSKDSIESEHVKNEIDRAFARLNQGIKIMPFLIDSAPMDDEFQYYLCRQEMYNGQQPPLVQRIREFAEKISNTLE